MSLSQNPIKVCLLFHEVLALLKPQFSVLHAALSDKQADLTHLCGLFLEEIESEDILLEFLYDTDLDGRKVTDLIKGHSSLLLKVRSAILKEWQGPLPLTTPSIFAFSTLYTITQSTPRSVLLLQAAYWN